MKTYQAKFDKKQGYYFMVREEGQPTYRLYWNADTKKEAEQFLQANDYTRVYSEIELATNGDAVEATKSFRR